VKGRDVETYDTLNDVLVNLFRDINDIEEKAITSYENKDLTSNDMHVIHAIGVGTKKNMSSIAKELSVTVGTLTISMNSLVKKGYVVRSRSTEDRRVNLPDLRATTAQISKTTKQMGRAIISTEKTSRRDLASSICSTV